MQIYGELAARWYRLLDPLEDHFDEAACYEAALLRGAPDGALTLLELGSGAGNNASYLKRRFACTLADRSPQMLGISRATNPECEHVKGDMRSLRLGRTFDAVFVHDAVMYITTEEDLHAVAET
ncbi:MAG: class I SAM-dependent methyltransferase, partial [Acidobacteriota bacterium]|nr:class I SAM-dependent methyltransferase [Acidobacteriota bacterium]